jgi:NAD(P)-dependent dehydrogenase (short-subunit alcohol dehydrogenase family)
MKLLIISGGSSGIGLATIRRFANDGYALVNLSRRRCPHPAVTQINCDLSVPRFLDNISAQLTALCSEAEQIVLIHNAARLSHDSAVETPSNKLREVIEINLVAPNTLNYFTIPYMHPGSSILYVGSTLSEKAVPGSFSYVTTKHAMVGMMRATCQDLAGREIHTACICPGFTDTEMLREHVAPQDMEAVRAMSTYGRLITPEEVAETLCWAAHHPVINGAVLHANLGQREQ